MVIIKINKSTWLYIFNSRTTKVNFRFSSVSFFSLTIIEKTRTFFIVKVSSYHFDKNIRIFSVIVKKKKKNRRKSEVYFGNSIFKNCTKPGFSKCATIVHVVSIGDVRCFFDTATTRKPRNRRINSPYGETFQPNHHLGGITRTPLPPRNFCTRSEESRV